MQQPMVPTYKITQNSLHSPSQPANFQPAAMSPNTPRWVGLENLAEPYIHILLLKSATMELFNSSFFLLYV